METCRTSVERDFYDVDDDESDEEADEEADEARRARILHLLLVEHNREFLELAVASNALHVVMWMLDEGDVFGPILRTTGFVADMINVANAMRAETVKELIEGVFFEDGW